jgi:hypothetical protein
MAESLPASVLSRQKFGSPTDLILALLRRDHPTLRIQSKVKLRQKVPLVLVRTARNPSGGKSDSRFTDLVQIEIQVYTQGVNADDDGERISEAMRVTLFDAWRNQVVVPGLGWLMDIEMTSRPHEVPDWATSTGPVQYADLPADFTRYETRYTVEIRTDPRRAA